MIWAMTQAPIALVAVLPETSVLFGSMIAVVILKEAMTGGGCWRQRLCLRDGPSGMRMAAALRAFVEIFVHIGSACSPVHFAPSRRFGDAAIQGAVPADTSGSQDKIFWRRTGLLTLPK